MSDAQRADAAEAAYRKLRAEVTELQSIIDTSGRSAEWRLGRINNRLQHIREGLIR